jgi:N-acetylated-alpha-linked acidic dipeptidase
MKKQYLLLFGALCHFGLWAQPAMPGYSAASREKQTRIETRFQSLTDWSAFARHLQNLTRDPHLAGSKANERVRDYMAESMKKAGWKVEIYPYDVYLPIGPGPSAVEIVTPRRIPLNRQENILKEDPFSAHPDLQPGWNAFSGSGDVTAEVVYANFGRKEDFEKLKSMGVEIRGKIVIARYGGNFRGYKAKYAQEYGAAGLIIYTDPADSGYARGLVYPEGPFFNESTIQRGSLLTLDFTGDPLTPFEPALPLDGSTKIARRDPAQTAFHQIPVLPLPYGAAMEIFKYMKGRPVPAGWQGGLPFTYRLEGGPELRMRLQVQQKKDFVRIHDVIGTLPGKDFPDEWIILGCHYDAWAFGATDPNSGTAMMLALAETLGKMTKEGLAPSRSILLAHWDAEEQGVIGSTEWVEQMKKTLDARAVAYINLDGAVSGRDFGASSAPSLKQVVMDVAASVMYPDSSKTLLEVWKGKDKNAKEPPLGNLGGGSDHIGFYMHLGIPSLNAGAGGPTLYHSNYDDYHFYSHFADSTLKAGGMMEQYIGALALRLANADLIPYQPSRYALDLETHFSKAEKALGSFADSTVFQGFTQSRAALKDLKKTGGSLEEWLRTSLDKPLEAARAKTINRQLMALEKCFIDPKGMYFGAWYRSLYASPDPFSGYASWMLPGIQYEIDTRNTSRLQEWDTRYSEAIRALDKAMQEIMR